MPLCLEAKRTFRVVLKIDEAKPKKTRPFFEFQYLSGRAWKEVATAADALDEATTGAEAIETVFNLLKKGLVGWGNMIDPTDKKEIKFDVDRLDEIVTLTEANELLAKFRNQGVESEDLKNSD